MTQEEIIEGNKLIAQFIGWEKRVRWWELPIDFPHHLMTGTYSKALRCEDDDLLFHSSWDWLMPVVEKIGDISCDYHLEANDNAYAECGKVMSTHVCVSIQTLWQRVVDFIKWFNTQPH